MQLFLTYLTGIGEYDTYDESTPTDYAWAALVGESYGDRNGIHQLNSFANRHIDLYRDIHDCICHDDYSYQQCDYEAELSGCKRQRVFAEMLESLPGDPHGFLDSTMQRQFRYMITPAGFGVIEQRFPLSLSRRMYFIHDSAT